MHATRGPGRAPGSCRLKHDLGWAMETRLKHTATAPLPRHEMQHNLDITLWIISTSGLGSWCSTWQGAPGKILRSAAVPADRTYCNTADTVFGRAVSGALWSRWQHTILACCVGLLTMGMRLKWQVNAIAATDTTVSRAVVTPRGVPSPISQTLGSTWTSGAAMPCTAQHFSTTPSTAARQQGCMCAGAPAIPCTNPLLQVRSQKAMGILNRIDSAKQPQLCTCNL